MRVSASVVVCRQRLGVVAGGQLDELANAQLRRQPDFLHHHADAPARLRRRAASRRTAARCLRPARGAPATARSPSTCRRRSDRAPPAARRAARRDRGRRGPRSCRSACARRPATRRARSVPADRRSPVGRVWQSVDRGAIVPDSFVVVAVANRRGYLAPVQQLSEEGGAHEVAIAQKAARAKLAIRISGNLTLQCHGSWPTSTCNAATTGRCTR